MKRIVEGENRQHPSSNPYWNVSREYRQPIQTGGSVVWDGINLHNYSDAQLKELMAIIQVMLATRDLERKTNG